mgnify:CR=1 FL=1
MQPLFLMMLIREAFVRIDINDFVYVQSVILSQIWSCYSFLKEDDYEKKEVRVDIYGHKSQNMNYMYVSITIFSAVIY